jgi:hypothetical protein
MPLPYELRVIDEETCVVGDIDALIDYIESGQAALDYEILHRRSMRDLEDIFRFEDRR